MCVCACMYVCMRVCVLACMFVYIGCRHVLGYVCEGQRAAHRNHLFPFMAHQESNSGCQVWQQMPLPAAVSCQPHVL